MVNHAHAAYPFIRDNLQEYTHNLMAFPECPYWVHEKSVADFIGLNRSDEFGQSTLLSSLIICIKNGQGGNKRNKNSFKLTGVDRVDLKDQGNGSLVCFQEYGTRENFQGVILVNEPEQRIPR